MAGGWYPPAIASETCEILRGQGQLRTNYPPDYFNGALTREYGYLSLSNDLYVIIPNDSCSNYGVVRFIQERVFPGNYSVYPNYIWEIDNRNTGGVIKFALADGTFSETITAPSASMGVVGLTAHPSQAYASLLTISKSISGATYILARALILCQTIQETYSYRSETHRPFSNGFETTLKVGYVTTLKDSPKVCVTTEVLIDTSNVSTQGIGSAWSTLQPNNAAGLLLGPSDCNGKIWNLQFRAWNQPGCMNPLRTTTIWGHSYGQTYPYDWVQKYPVYFYVTSTSGTHRMHTADAVYLWVSTWFAWLDTIWVGDILSTANSQYSRSIGYRDLYD